MIFILKDLKSKTIIIIFNKTLDIVQKSKLLINAINDFILFRCIKMLKIEKIVRKYKNIKT